MRYLVICLRALGMNASVGEQFVAPDFSHAAQRFTFVLEG
jgi:hypothetical protein